MKRKILHMMVALTVFSDLYNDTNAFIDKPIYPEQSGPKENTPMLDSDTR